ncbi:MAG: GNAT family N-acetyltransferase, partial [Oscillospiraceae bacterium]
CNSHDGIVSTLFLSNDFNFDKNMKSFFLLYAEKKLVSFLTLFCPSKQEAELSAMTLPDSRRKGYFNQLLSCAKEELNRFNLDNILFVHNPKSMDAKNILDKLATTLEFSEYIMHYQGPEVAYNSDMLTLVEVGDESDKDSIVTIFTSAFDGESEEESIHWFECNFASKTSQIYKAMVNEKSVGTLCVNYERDPVSIFGVCVCKEEQGKGYGKEMFLSILSKLTKENRRIHLDVNSSNNIAFTMYQKYGFTVTAQSDYYRYIF